ncbi:hypothetical protein CDAR_376931 [Caerostris darwini]|uniref:Prokineticin domain-containing protein n=1 Tax=Caerostris darwini TaxID=1538125 RepID=A0AAV4PEW6_9ARAC|nr:hypothetical protein CDAR_376931 [Caerostris darwini]
MRSLSFLQMFAAVFLVLLMLLHMLWATFVVIRPCNKNEDCKEDECCLQKPWTTRFFCAKRVREGKVCWSKLHNATANWDKYRVICPCLHKHECKFQEPIFVLKPILGASTCQKKKDDMDMMMR